MVKMARLFTTTRSWNSLQPRKEPRHGHVADLLPGLKKCIGTLGLKDSAKLLVIRVVVAFLLHAGRMSCLRAAGAVRCEARHRAQISRFLARPRWRKLNIRYCGRGCWNASPPTACSCLSSTPR